MKLIGFHERYSGKKYHRIKKHMRENEQNLSEPSLMLPGDEIYIIFNGSYFLLSESLQNYYS